MTMPVPASAPLHFLIRAGSAAPAVEAWSTARVSSKWALWRGSMRRELQGALRAMPPTSGSVLQAEYGGPASHGEAPDLLVTLFSNFDYADSTPHDRGGVRFERSRAGPGRRSR